MSLASPALVVRLFTTKPPRASAKSAPAPKKGSKKSFDQGPEEGRQEAQAQLQGELLRVRVQGAEASPSGHRHLVQGHGNHELLRQRHFRAHCWRGIAPGALQQALDYHIQGDPDRRALAATWGAGQAHRVRGH